MRSAKSDYETNIIQSFANRNSSKIYKYTRGITRQVQYHLLSTLSLPLLPLTVTEHLCSMPTSTQSLPTVRLHYHHLKTFHFLSMSKWFVTSIFLNLKPTTFWLHWSQPRQWALHDGIGPKLITKALCSCSFPCNHFITYSLSVLPNTTFLKNGASTKSHQSTSWGTDLWLTIIDLSLCFALSQRYLIKPFTTTLELWNNCSGSNLSLILTNLRISVSLSMGNQVTSPFSHKRFWILWFIYKISNK